MKRVLDILISGLALAALAPVLAAVAVAIRVASPGPALFWQQRVGLHGSQFWLVKFRSMHVARLGERRSTTTIAGDPRVFPLGAWLRRWKLDELPQLFNVLKGEMSLVGPRPDVPEVVARLTEEERVILSVRPGMTGPASLRYRDEESLLAQHADPEGYNSQVVYPDKVKINVAYVHKHSTLGDAKWLTLTVLSLFCRVPQHSAHQGANRADSRVLSSDTAEAEHDRLAA